MSIPATLSLALAALAAAILPATAWAADSPPRPEIFLQLGHNNLVQALSPSPDGRTLASGDFDGLVKLWDAESGKEVGSFPRQPMPVMKLAWTPDGRALFGTTANGRILWLDPQRLEIRGERSCMRAGKSPEVRALAVSPDGRKVACGNLDGDVSIFDTASGNPLQVLETDKEGVRALAYSRDGTRLVAGGIDEVWYWSDDEAGRQGRLKVPEAVSQLVLLADDRSVAVSFGFMFATKDTAIRIYDLEHGTETLALTGAKGTTNALALGNDGQTLYSGMFSRPTPGAKSILELISHDYRIHEWDLSTGRLARTHDGHSGNIAAIAVAPDGKRFFSGSWDKTLRTWNRDDGSARILAGHGLEAKQLFQLHSGWGVIDDRGRVVAWKPDSGEVFRMTPPLADIDPEAAAFKLRAAVPTENGIVAVFQGNLDRMLVGTVGSDGPQPVETVRPDLRKWVSPEIEEKFGFSGTSDIPRVFPLFAAAALSREGRSAFLGVRYMASGNLFDFWSRVAVWDVQERRLSGFVPGVIEGEISAVAVSADRRTLLVATTQALRAELNAPKKIMLHAIRAGDGKPLWSMQGEAGRPIEALAISKDGRTAIAADGFEAKVVDLASGALRARLSGHQKVVSALAISDDGRTIATGGVDANVGLWDAGTGKRIAWLQGHTGSIRSLLFLQDKHRLLSLAQDQTVRLWDLKSRDPMVTMAAFDGGDWATLTTEGYFAASPAGAEQIGFRIGNRNFQLNQFYDLFYRPDLVRRKLGGESIERLTATSVSQALAAPPPDVYLSLPESTGTADQVEVTVMASSAGGGIGEIRVFHNGKLVRSDGFLRPITASSLPLFRTTPQVVVRGLAASAARRESAEAPAGGKGSRFEERLQIRPTAGENEIAIAAFNASNSVQSRIVTKRFFSQRPPQSARLHVVAVGIDKFLAGRKVALRYAAKDAFDFTALLSERLRTAVMGSLETAALLTDANATKKNVIRALQDVAEKAGPQDAFVLFVATHGIFDSETYAFLTHDYRGEITAASTISAPELLEALKRIPAQRQLVVLDTCHAGGMDNALGGLYDSRMTNLARNVGLHVFASSGSFEEAIDGIENNGLFTHVLLGGLKFSKADLDQDGRITVFEVGDYGRKAASVLARRLGHVQTPLVLRYGKDYPIVLYK